MKEKILEELKKVDREGMEGLIQYLKEVGYFESPASTKYHLSVQGGLAKHSYCVLQYFREAMKDVVSNLQEESIIICGLLHDICKCGLYPGQQKPYGYNASVGNRGHAKLSVERLEKFIILTAEEKYIIRFHMGTFGIFDYNGNENGEYNAHELHEAIKDYPAVQIFAAMDMKSSKSKLENY